VRLIRLRPNTIRRLQEIERTPNADPWVAEVESFILDGGAASHRFEPLSAILLADDDGRLVGAAVHHPDAAYPGAQYISAVLVDHRMRGQGLGRAVFRAVIDDARSSSGRPYVLWVVHPQNLAMIALSREMVAGGVEVGRERNSGYLIFIDP
jgi:GNAT superfamily N-acetyltransferase